MYRIGVKYGFSAAHRLDGYEGKCSGLHGHSWTVEAVFLSAETESGMVLDFEQVRSALHELVGCYDHTFLNEVKPFNSLVPTAENLARVFFDSLIERGKESGWTAELEQVTVWESADTWASYSA